MTSENPAEFKFRFSDDGGATSVVVDFSSDHRPPLGQLILVWGTVEPSPLEVDVVEWTRIASTPTPPIDPPVTPPDSTVAPTLVITPIRDITSGNVFGEVLIAGTVVRQNGSDRDEWFVEDNTDEIVVDFRSDHIPSVGTSIIVWGTAGSSEIDEIEWCPVAACG